MRSLSTKTKSIDEVVKPRSKQIMHRFGSPSMIRKLCLLLCLCLYSPQAFADLRVCNESNARVGVALGYRDSAGWTTEGWWNIAGKSCETMLRGTLAARYYYIYAIDYDQGGEWAGRVYMCTRAREFTIRGIEDCLARGFERTGFFEIDTQEQASWTIQLSDKGKPAQ